MPQLVVTGAGHAPTVWRDRIASVPTLDVAALRASVPGRDRLVVVSAHPDDETIGAGRLLAAWRRSGGRATADLATAGEACVDHVGERPTGLAQRRLTEWQRALDVLGVAAGSTYGLADGALQTSGDELDAAIARTVADADLDRVVLLAPHPDDPHPDHRAVGQAVRRVGERSGVPVWFFPVWLTYWSDPGADLDGQLVGVTVQDVDDRARDAAVACFETQLAPLAEGWGAVVPSPMLAHHDRQLLVLPAATS